MNNTVYLRWVQEVATAHWQAIASSEAQESIGWVVLRHEIDYKTPACLGDDVVLRTWVAKRPGLRSNGLLKSEGAAMASCCQLREHSGARKCANRQASPRAGGSARAVFDLTCVDCIRFLDTTGNKSCSVRCFTHPADGHPGRFPLRTADTTAV